MSYFRSYSAGYDGTLNVIGNCPFDMDRIQKEYVNGSISPTKIINFGASSGSDSMSTLVDIAVTALASVPNADGKQSLDLLACSSFFETSVLNFRLPNLHKPGSARASDFWGVIPTNVVSPKLLQKLHQGGVDRTVVSSLAFIDKGEKDKPRVVQTAEYTTCFIKSLDMTSYGFLTVFSFSFVKIKITQIDIKQISEGGKNVDAGQYVYEFDYNSGEGSAS